MFVGSVPVVDVLLVCFPYINWLYLVFVRNDQYVYHRNTDNEHKIQPINIGKINDQYVYHRNTDNEHNIQPINIGKTNGQYVYHRNSQVLRANASSPTIKYGISLSSPGRASAGGM
jgi:hypothetical protein